MVLVGDARDVSVELRVKASVVAESLCVATARDRAQPAADGVALGYRLAVGAARDAVQTFLDQLAELVVGERSGLLVRGRVDAVVGLGNATDVVVEHGVGEHEVGLAGGAVVAARLERPADEVVGRADGVAAAEVVRGIGEDGAAALVGKLPTAQEGGAAQHADAAARLLALSVGPGGGWVGPLGGEGDVGRAVAVEVVVVVVGDREDGGVSERGVSRPGVASVSWRGSH